MSQEDLADGASLPRPGTAAGLPPPIGATLLPKPGTAEIRLQKVPLGLAGAGPTPAVPPPPRIPSAAKKVAPPSKEKSTKEGKSLTPSDVKKVYQRFLKLNKGAGLFSVTVDEAAELLSGIPSLSWVKLVDSGSDCVDVRELIVFLSAHTKVKRKTQLRFAALFLGDPDRPNVITVEIAEIVRRGHEHFHEAFAFRETLLAAGDASVRGLKVEDNAELVARLVGVDVGQLFENRAELGVEEYIGAMLPGERDKKAGAAVVSPEKKLGRGPPGTRPATAEGRARPGTAEGPRPGTVDSSQRPGSAAEVASRPGTAATRSGSVEGRPGSADGRPGSADGRPGSAEPAPRFLERKIARPRKGSIDDEEEAAEEERRLASEEGAGTRTSAEDTSGPELSTGASPSSGAKAAAKAGSAVPPGVAKDEAEDPETVRPSPSKRKRKRKTKEPKSVSFQPRVEFVGPSLDELLKGETTAGETEDEETDGGETDEELTSRLAGLSGSPSRFRQFDTEDKRVYVQLLSFKLLRGVSGRERAYGIEDPFLDGYGSFSTGAPASPTKERRTTPQKGRKRLSPEKYFDLDKSSSSGTGGAARAALDAVAAFAGSGSNKEQPMGYKKVGKTTLTYAKVGSQVLSRDQINHMPKDELRKLQRDFVFAEDFVAQRDARPLEKTENLRERVDGRFDRAERGVPTARKEQKAKRLSKRRKNREGKASAVTPPTAAESTGDEGGESSSATGEGGETSPDGTATSEDGGDGSSASSSSRRGKKRKKRKKRGEKKDGKDGTKDPRANDLVSIVVDRPITYGKSATSLRGKKDDRPLAKTPDDSEDENEAESFFAGTGMQPPDAARLLTDYSADTNLWSALRWIPCNPAAGWLRRFASLVSVGIIVAGVLILSAALGQEVNEQNQAAMNQQKMLAAFGLVMTCVGAVVFGISSCFFEFNVEAAEEVRDPRRGRALRNLEEEEEAQVLMPELDKLKGKERRLAEKRLRVMMRERQARRAEEQAAQLAEGTRAAAARKERERERKRVEGKKTGRRGRESDNEEGVEFDFNPFGRTGSPGDKMVEQSRSERVAENYRQRAEAIRQAKISGPELAARREEARLLRGGQLNYRFAAARDEKADENFGISVAAGARGGIGVGAASAGTSVEPAGGPGGSSTGGSGASRGGGISGAMGRMRGNVRGFGGLRTRAGGAASDPLPEQGGGALLWATGPDGVGGAAPMSMQSALAATRGESPMKAAMAHQGGMMGGLDLHEAGYLGGAMPAARTVALRPGTGKGPRRKLSGAFGDGTPETDRKRRLSDTFAEFNNLSS